MEIFVVCSLSRQWAAIGWEQAFGYIRRWAPDKPLHIRRVPTDLGLPFNAIAVEETTVLDNPSANE